MLSDANGLVVLDYFAGEVDLLGKKRVMGPSSVSIGDGAVHIGNRGGLNICVINAHSDASRL